MSFIIYFGMYTSVASFMTFAVWFLLASSFWWLCTELGWTEHPSLSELYEAPPKIQLRPLAFCSPLFFCDESTNIHLLECFWITAGPLKMSDFYTGMCLYDPAGGNSPGWKWAYHLLK